jgi:hypothetical protein
MLKNIIIVRRISSKVKYKLKKKLNDNNIDIYRDNPEFNTGHINSWYKYKRNIVLYDTASIVNQKKEDKKNNIK